MYAGERERGGEGGRQRENSNELIILEKRTAEKRSQKILYQKS